MSEPTDDFEYERRFFCRELPAEYDDGDAPTLIIQSYYVHADNYALRVRLVSRKVHVDMTPDVNPVAVLDEYRDRFSEAYVTVKGPSVGARATKSSAKSIRVSRPNSSSAAAR